MLRHLRHGSLGVLILHIATAMTSAGAGDDFPSPRNSEPDQSPVMPAMKAASAFRVPDGFRVQVFAAEPEIRNPIAMAWDARGRLWIAENYTYAERALKFDLRYRDRVVVLEDRDGDGVSDHRTVFTDDVQRLSSVEIGRGGAWLLCPPQLLFVPDRDGNAVPDGPAEVVLDGFVVPDENYHGFANGLRWGPDGWLYGRCGASSPGRVGVPGTPEPERTPINGGIWRYHPDRKWFEVLCHGTTNPWGHDWNALGEAFFINTVNGHLWHMIPGAHFVRPHTIDPNPRAYALIDQHADHWHWDTAKDWTDSRSASGEHDKRGGGHAHSGLMIYGGDQWPLEDRGKLFTLNFHGRRTNVERLERSGSGYLGRHEPDRFFAGDPWFRGLDLSSGPDGGVYVLDWSDTGECHDSTGVHRTSGRIFKISHGATRPAPAVDLTKLDPAALLGLQSHPNTWFARQARIELAGRNARDAAVSLAGGDLIAQIEREADPVRTLHLLWTLHDLGGANEGLLRRLLAHQHEAVRAWAIRLLTDEMPIDTVMGRRPRPDGAVRPELLEEFARVAREDRSGLVRLVLASTLQRLPIADRARLAAPLLARNEDAEDHNLPLLLWYGLAPIGDADPSALAALATEGAHPTTRRMIARRLAEDLDRNPAPLDALLARATADKSPSFRRDVAEGVAEGVSGWRKAAKPAAWDDFSKRLAGEGNAATRSRVRDLDVLFGDGRALEEVRRIALDDKADLESRRAALRTLIEARPPDLRAICERVLRVRFLNTAAVRALAQFDDPAIGRALAASYKAFHPSERPAVLDTLVSRPSFARELLDQVATGAIPRSDLTPFHARQIRTLEDERLLRRLAEVWGELRETATDKKETIERFRSRLRPEHLAASDLSRGRLLFNKTCSSCHALYGHGGAIGPDLTGAGRQDLDYVLENLIDPSASVSADFRMVVLAMKDGRVLNGIVRARTGRTLTLQTQNESLILERNEIERESPSPVSLMPEGLLTPLQADEARDLIAYLMHRTQVPLPGGIK
ncbi:MAG: Cytochrome c [Planctomycetota bacterium]|nr:Cytochrome c [Planctomycetota bacterium]